MDAKLKCVFEMPSADANAENTSGGGGGAIGVGGTGSAGGGSAGINTSSASAEALESKPKLSSEDMVRYLQQLLVFIMFITPQF